MYKTKWKIGYDFKCKLCSKDLLTIIPIHDMFFEQKMQMPYSVSKKEKPNKWYCISTATDYELFLAMKKTNKQNHQTTKI